MRKTLFVTDGAFPPSSGSSIILNNLASQFHPDNVVLAGEKSFGADLKAYTRPKYHVHRINHKFTFDRQGSRYGIWTQLFKVEKELEVLVLGHNVRQVIAVFPNEFYCFAAARVAKKMKLPFYCWFHNTFLDNRVGIFKLLAKKLQPYIFQQSNVVFTMSEGMNNFMQQRYQEFRDKFKPLLHGFEVPNMPTEVDVFISGKIKFLLNGNINESNKDSTERLCKAVLSNKKNELYVYTGTPLTTFKKMGVVGKNFYYNEFLPNFSDLVTKFKEFDVMLLPHGFVGGLSVAEYQTIFPTRTIPLLYSGKPILAHCPPKTSLSHFLETHQCAKLVTEKDVQTIEKAIDELCTDRKLREELVQNSFTVSKLFSAENTYRELLKITSGNIKFL